VALVRGSGETRWAEQMNDLRRSSPAVLVAPEVRAPIKRRTPVALHQCLVVSASARRAQLWVRAAHEENWTTIVCTTAADAIRQAVRNRIDLALIDLQSAEGDLQADLRALVEHLASRGGSLLAVCGTPEDTFAEVWSRQLGVWMYLPGIDSESDIALLCAEARNILKKLEDQAARSL